MSAAGWLWAYQGGVRVALKVTPKASKAGVTGLQADGAGQMRLAVRVRAAPEGGRANAELIRLLARRWRLPASRIDLVSGAGARHKLLRLSGPPDELCARLQSIEQGVEPGGG